MVRWSTAGQPPSGELLYINIITSLSVYIFFVAHRVPTSSQHWGPGDRPLFNAKKGVHLVCKPRGCQKQTRRAPYGCKPRAAITNQLIRAGAVGSEREHPNFSNQTIACDIGAPAKPIRRAPLAASRWLLKANTACHFGLQAAGCNN